MNNDLISRSAHIDKFTAEAKKIAANDKDFAQALMYVVTCLDAAPAVDAVEVVRCKDCRFWRNFHAVDNCFLPSGLSHAAPDSYCSLGRRKDK